LKYCAVDMDLVVNVVSADFAEVLKMTKMSVLEIFMSGHKQKMDQMSLELKVAEKPRFLGGHIFEGLLDV